MQLTMTDLPGDPAMSHHRPLTALLLALAAVVLPLLRTEAAGAEKMEPAPPGFAGLHAIVPAGQSADSTSKRQGQHLQQLSTDQAAARGLRTTGETELVTTGSNQYRLEKGSVLAHKSGALALQTPHGSVQISSGAAVLVIVEPELTRVLDLFDSHVGSVKVMAGEKTFKTAPGAQITIVSAGKQEDVPHLLLKDGIRRRQVRVVPATSGWFVVSDEFSIVDAVMKHELLHRIHTSEDQESKRLMENILKTAAALVVGGSHEPYTTVHP